jgi:hypothetical protein
MRLNKLILAGTLLLGPCCFADTISIVLDSTSPGQPGDTLVFNGTITNLTSSTVDLNSLSLSLSDPYLTGDITPFLTGVPLFLAPGANSGDLPLFYVTISNPFPEAPGPITGSTATVLGGIETKGYDSTMMDNLGATAFTVDVTAQESAVPEPATAALIAGASLLLFVRRKLSGSQN